MTENRIQAQDAGAQTIVRDVDLPRVHGRLLEMGSAVAEILEQHDIPYMIAFGTLLGAVRHRGFIPWDDDFDMFLFDETYEMGIEVLRTKLPVGMFLEDAKSEPRYFHGWAHVKDLGSEVHCSKYPQDAVYAHHGVSVDLYRCKPMNLNELCGYRIEEARKYLARLARHGVVAEKDAASRFELLSRRIEKEEEENRNSMSRVLGMVLTTVVHQFMYCSDVFPLKKTIFCNKLFFGPQDADAVLRHFYGNYMQLPEKQAQVPHCDKIVFYR